MTRWCPSYSCRYHCIFVNVETKIMTKDEETIIIIKISFFFRFFQLTNQLIESYEKGTS